MDIAIRVPKTRSRTGCFTCRKRKKKCDELLYPICQNCQEKNIVCQWPLKKHEFHKKMGEVKYIGYEDKISKARESQGHRLRRDSTQQLNMDIEDEIYSKKPSKGKREGQKGHKEAGFMPIRPFSKAGDLLGISGFENNPSTAQDAGYANKSRHEVPAQHSDSTPDTYDNGARDLENQGQYENIRHSIDSKTVKSFGVSKLDSIQLQKKRRNYFLERIAMQQDCVDSEEDMTNVSPASPFEIDSLIDNDYVLNDRDKQDGVDRANSPIPKAETKKTELHQPQMAFPHQPTVSRSNQQAKVHNSLAPLKTTTSTHENVLSSELILSDIPLSQGVDHSTLN